MTKYYIVVFKNTLDAMNAEKKIKRIKFYIFRMMPTPTSIIIAVAYVLE